MIKKLTEAQEKQLSIYRDKWMEVGLKTGPCNKKRTIQLIEKAYSNAGLGAPEVLFFDSPFAASVYLKKEGLEGRPCYGNHNAGWLSFYDFIYNVLELKTEVEPLLPLIELAKEIGWWWPFDKACIVSERPVRISMKYREEVGRKVLHDDYGPAILYADGFKGYYLNGTLMADEGKMMPELVETPAEDLDPALILRIKNVEVRRELMQKIGLDRLYGVLKNKTIDTKNEYELVDLNITKDHTGRYLKMLNPSTAAIHLEGVPNECNTVDEALAWRDGDCGEYNVPEILT